MKSEEQIRAALEVLGAVGAGKTEQQAAALRWVLGEDPVATVMEEARAAIAERDRIQIENRQLLGRVEGFEKAMHNNAATLNQVIAEREHYKQRLAAVKLGGM